jgi:hypothetical protein
LRHTRWFRRIALLGFSVASTIALSALALAPALSSAATVTGMPKALPSCAAVEAGFDSRQNAQITTLADGGKLYTYEQNGQKIVLPQPPADFAPLKASDEELERYGFPPRPSAKDADHLAHWQELMAGYRSTGAPVTCNGAPPPRTGETEPVSHTVVGYNNIWSGFMTYDPGNRSHWNAAEADFFQINGAAHTSCSSDAVASSWVGLGGWNYGGLIQAGTDAYTSGKTSVWYEWIAGSFDESAYFPEMYVNPGDYIGVLVEYKVSTETATYVTYDQNTGVFRSVVMPGMPSQFYDGSTGDFMDERPTSRATGKILPLLNFSTHMYYYAEVRNSAGNWAWLGEPNRARVLMYSNPNGTGNLLADPGLMESVNSFRDTYYHCE